MLIPRSFWSRAWQQVPLRLQRQAVARYHDTTLSLIQGMTPGQAKTQAQESTRPDVHGSESAGCRVERWLSADRPSPPLAGVAATLVRARYYVALLAVPRYDGMSDQAFRLACSKARERAQAELAEELERTCREGELEVRLGRP